MGRPYMHRLPSNHGWRPQDRRPGCRASPHCLRVRFINPSTSRSALADPWTRCLWTVGYNLSAGPMGYIYVAETATTRLRAKTSGIAIIGIQAMATVYVYIAPIMLNAPALGMSNTGTGTSFPITFLYLMFCEMQCSSGLGPGVLSIFLSGCLCLRRRAGHLLNWTSCLHAGFQHGGLLRQKQQCSGGLCMTTRVAIRIRGQGMQGSLNRAGGS